MRNDDGDPGSGRTAEADVVDHVIAAEHALAAASAQRLTWVYALLRDAQAAASGTGQGRVIEVAYRSARLELAAALRTTEYRAENLLRQAETLISRYPRVFDAFAAAEITEAHASALTDTADTIDPPVRDQLVETALVHAKALPLGPFRKLLTDLANTLQEPTLAERYERTVAGRYVKVDVEPDGIMATLTLFMPALDARAAYNRATAMAKSMKAQKEESRSIDQLRADILSDLLIDGETESLDPALRGIRPIVTVTVPALSLLGVEGGSARVEGLGPIPLEQAKELCGNAPGWMRVLTHPETGVIVSVGRTMYKPPADLARFVRYRAGRCMAPGCAMPANRCEIDHTIAWEHGGDTAADNLAPLCKGHHTIKHHGRWKVSQIPGSGGAFEWISPHGRRYEVRPERRIPTFRVERGPFDEPPAKKPPRAPGTPRPQDGVDLYDPAPF